MEVNLNPTNLNESILGNKTKPEKPKSFFDIFKKSMSQTTQQVETNQGYTPPSYTKMT